MKANAKKRRMYEAFIESVPLLKSLEVSLAVENPLTGSSNYCLFPFTSTTLCIAETSTMSLEILLVAEHQPVDNKNVFIMEKMFYSN